MHIDLGRKNKFYAKYYVKKSLSWSKVNFSNEL